MLSLLMRNEDDRLSESAVCNGLGADKSSSLDRLKEGLRCKSLSLVLFGLGGLVLTLLDSVGGNAHWVSVGDCLSSDLIMSMGIILTGSCVKPLWDDLSDGDSGRNNKLLCWEIKEICLTSSSFSELTKDGGLRPRKCAGEAFSRVKTLSYWGFL